MRLEVPIFQTRLPNGSIRYFLRLKVGDARVNAMLDSGSVGLRLLPRAVPSRAYRRMSRQCVYTFANGVELRGNFARARIALDDTGARRAIRAQVVRKLCCGSQHPNCPAEQIRRAGFRIFGEGFAGEGFRAVLGVGLRASGVDNPLGKFADAWIIRLPLPGEEKPGSLIVGPTSYERRGFARFALVRHRISTPMGNAVGWQDVVPGTLTTQNPRGILRGPIALDTGAPFITVITHKEHAPDATHGREAKISFAQPRRRALMVKFDINDRDTPGSRLFLRRPVGRQWEGIRAGILPFHSFEVLYDQKRGSIGLKAR